jgi:hypothetical protein
MSSKPVLLLLLSVTFAAVVTGRGYSGHDTQGPSSVGVNMQTDSTRYPAAEATHRTSQIAASVSCSGGMGLYGGSDPSFVFPAGSEVSYLFSGEIWVGGIIKGDTGVSTANQLQYRCDGELLTTTYGQELYPPSSHYDVIRHLRPLASFGRGAGFRTETVDTFTAEHGLRNFNMGWGGHAHRPVGLSIVQKSYTLDEPPYDKILLLDYIISNISSDTIHQAWFGIFLDPDCYYFGDGNHAGWQDDFPGSLRDISTAYGIDNDGDPQHGAFLTDYSTVDAIGLRPVRIHPHVPDTNFNWWTRNYSAVHDFGPRLRPTSDDPWYELNCGSTGIPVGDASKYYVLSHDEWDYDMYRTPTIDSTDSLWMYPSILDSFPEFGRGTDAGFLMSVGPVDLAPERSMRAVWAVFAGEWVHVDPDNTDNLHLGRLEEFYERLHFDVFRQTAGRAVDMSHDLLNPTDPPTGLEVTRCSNDTAWIQWDPWVFPEVTGYRLAYHPLFPDSRGTSGAIGLPAEVHRTTLTGLPLHVPYVTRLTQLSDRGWSEPSPPVLFGIDNRATTTEPVEPRQNSVFIDRESGTVRLSWSAPETTDGYRYYRIYRTADSVTASNRHAAFVTDRPDTVQGTPKQRRVVGDSEYCLFAMEPYDSVSVQATEWVDRNPIEDSWYWITGVFSAPFEGRPSRLTPCRAAPPEPERELLVVLAGSGQHDYAVPDSVTSFYGRVLDGLDYEYYFYVDSIESGSVNRANFTRFNTVLIEEGTAGQLFLGDEAHPDLLGSLVDAGRNVVYFGFPPGDEEVAYVFDVERIEYRDHSPEHSYLGLDSTVARPLKVWYSGLGVVDTLAGFVRAVPDDGWPVLDYDAGHPRVSDVFARFFSLDSCLPFTPAFFPSDRARVVYTYASTWPESSHLQGLPCGVQVSGGSGRVHVFSFHLWGIREVQARQLVEKLLQSSSEPSFVAPPIPEEFSLQQNYPNPFNSGTTISFSLDRWSEVTLEVYNVLGRLVATLLDGEVMPDGVVHTVQWDGTAVSGEQVATGVYLYRLKAGKRAVTRKMMLLR